MMALVLIWLASSVVLAAWVCRLPFQVPTTLRKPSHARLFASPISSASRVSAGAFGRPVPQTDQGRREAARHFSWSRAYTLRSPSAFRMGPLAGLFPGDLIEKAPINAMSFGESHLISLPLNRDFQQLNNFAIVKYACVTA
jgi:hypothetical protein